MNEFTQKLLVMVDELGDKLTEFIITPPGKLRINPIPKRTYYSALSRLERRGLILKKKQGKMNSYFVTGRGKKLLHKPVTKNRRSDGFSTIIIFDIPEEKSRQRTIFRRYLQKNGYTLLQKSVLIAPFALSQDIKDLIEELDIRRHISVIDGKINYF